MGSCKGNMTRRMEVLGCDAISEWEVDDFVDRAQKLRCSWHSETPSDEVDLHVNDDEGGARDDSFDCHRIELCSLRTKLETRL